MSLHPESLGSVPEEAARVARAAFPPGNLYMRMRDEIGVIYTDEELGCQHYFFRIIR
jgi:transposase